MSKNQKISNTLIDSPRTLIGTWRANSKLAKASKICNIVVPSVWAAITILASIVAFLPYAKPFFTGNPEVIAEFLPNWFLVVIVCLVIPAPLIGLMRMLFETFSTISIGNYVTYNGIDARDVYSNLKGTSKQDERLFCRAVWSNERPSSRVFLFIKVGITFMFNAIDMACMCTILFLISFVMASSNGTFDLGDLIAGSGAMIISSVLVGIIISVAIASTIFGLVTDAVIKNKSESNMYSKL